MVVGLLRPYDSFSPKRPSWSGSRSTRFGESLAIRRTLCANRRLYITPSGGSAVHNFVSLACGLEFGSCLLFDGCPCWRTDRKAPSSREARCVLCGIACEPPFGHSAAHFGPV